MTIQELIREATYHLPTLAAAEKLANSIYNSNLTSCWFSVRGNNLQSEAVYETYYGEQSVYYTVHCPKTGKTLRILRKGSAAKGKPAKA